jgi:hypothetical protein
MIRAAAGIFTTVILMFFLNSPAAAAGPASENQVIEKEIYSGPDETGAESPGDKTSDDGFLFEGLYKNIFLLRRDWDGTPGSDVRYLAGDMNRIRLSPEYRQGESLTVRFDLDTEAVFSNYRSAPAFAAMWIPSTYNEPFPGIYEISENSSPYSRVKLHRAYAKYSKGSLTATAGRQQIRFGSGRLWNPLDILNPVSPTAVEGADEQRGVDGLRADYFFDELTEMTAAWVPRLKKDSFSNGGFENHNSIARFKRAVNSFEAALIGGYISKRAAAGADISDTVFEGTLRGALIAFMPQRGKNFICAGAGYEYTFRNGIYFIMEYFYNGSSLGSDPMLKAEYYRSALYGADQSSSEILSNRFLTWNRHYGGAGTGYDFHPLVRGEAYFIADFEGRGLMFMPSVRYSALENLDIAGSVMSGAVFSGADNRSDFDDLSGSPLFMLSITGYF